MARAAVAWRSRITPHHAASHHGVGLLAGCPPAGPGAYAAEGVTRTGQTLDYLNKPGATSAFKASAHSLILSGNPDAPPPTAYTLVRGCLHASQVAHACMHPKVHGLCQSPPLINMGRRARPLDAHVTNEGAH